jgi:pimeloyl-ACP methyl ester carboxylesterase
VSTWVLLRGLVREQRHWGDFPALFAAGLPGAHVITLDLPGNGARHAERSPTRIAAMVDDCRATLRARGVTGPINVLALSLGGMVALEWCARHPDDVAHLVMINTSMRPFSAFYRRLRPQNYAAIVRQVLTGDAAAMERLVLRLTSNGRIYDGAIDSGASDSGASDNGASDSGTIDHGASDNSPFDAALLARWIGYQREFPVTRANAMRQLLAAARYRAPAVAPAHTRMLVLSSRADRLVDAACSRDLAAAWRLDSEVHPTAGHDLPLDDGAWVAATVRRWLSRGGPA